jgi:Rrf2 family protein
MRGSPESFMKITAQEEYGLRCLLQLARAGEGQSLSIPDIATAEGLSAPYVAKLLAVLRQEGFIESARGRAGGYRLTANPSEIRLGQVLEALGEPLFDEVEHCQRYAGTETDLCVHLSDCTLRTLWQTLEQWMRHTLNQLTLADLLPNDHRIIDLLRQRLAEVVQQPEPELLTLKVVSRS